MNNKFIDMSNKFTPPGQRLVFEFGSQEAAEYFKTWLCELGEQHYWQWMEEAESVRDGDITALSFDYHTGDEAIPAKCGRLDEQ